MDYDFVAIGGGAAGFFGAIAYLDNHPGARVAILEKTQQVLSKVRISGGGRCNVTHHQFDPKELVKNYPRGSKEMLGPFHRFGPQDTIAWFEGRGVPLKVEEDGRMFPTTDSSETIIQCLRQAAEGIELRLGAGVERIEPDLTIHLKGGEVLKAKKILLATGSVPFGHRLAEALGHTIVSPVPSLFTFNVPTSPLLDLAGVSVEEGIVRLPQYRLERKGPILITHWGFSGPAVLKLSAFAARELYATDYKTEIEIDWGETLPRRLRPRVGPLERYQMEGKTTFKQEFVTAGGIELTEVNFKTMESKLIPGLHFAGEILNIDGITGGFNFQNAWTGGWIAGSAQN